MGESAILQLRMALELLPYMANELAFQHASPAELKPALHFYSAIHPAIPVHPACISAAVAAAQLKGDDGDVNASSSSDGHTSRCEETKKIITKGHNVQSVNGKSGRLMRAISISVHNV